MASEAYPDFNDVTDHVDGGLARRALIRYFIPRDADASIKRHRFLGTQFTRRMIMSKAVRGTFGRLIGGYNLDAISGRRMESAMDFAAASTITESVHTAGALFGAYLMAQEAAEGGSPLVGATLIFAGNLAIAALQRYNRARIVRFVGRRLQAGDEFADGYRNWLGIDASAVSNFYEAQQPEIPGTVPTQPNMPPNPLSSIAD